MEGPGEGQRRGRIAQWITGAPLGKLQGEIEHYTGVWGEAWAAGLGQQKSDQDNGLFPETRHEGEWGVSGL